MRTNRQKNPSGTTQRGDTVQLGEREEDERTSFKGGRGRKGDLLQGEAESKGHSASGRAGDVKESGEEE